MNIKKIMIIDDDIEFLNELKEFLQLNDFQVDAFSNGLEAFEEITVKKPDLILLDLKMNPLSGIQIAILIRLSPKIKNIPIIIISSYNNDDQMKESLKQLNIEGYLPKTSSPDEILNKINSV